MALGPQDVVDDERMDEYDADNDEETVRRDVISGEVV